MPPKRKQSAPSIPTPSTSIFRLPLEVMTIILSHLEENDRPTIARLCRVSKDMFSIAAPILYKSIFVSPLLAYDSRADHTLDRFTATGKEKTNTRKKKLLKNAELVVIDSHHATWCGHKSFKYPNLKTLVLILTINGFGSVLHCNDILEKQCSLVKCLEPKKLVLFGMNMTSITTFEMFGVPPKIFSNVQELTSVAIMDETRPRTVWGGFQEMPKLKKLVWFFHTTHPSMEWQAGSRDFLGLRRNHTPCETDLHALAHFLQTTPNVPTYVVNSGSLHPKYVGETTASKDRIQTKFVEYLKSIMLDGKIGPWCKEGWKEGTSESEKEEKRKEYRSRFDNIHFISMKEYLQNHDWSGEIVPHQAKLWLALAI